VEPAKRRFLGVAAVVLLLSGLACVPARTQAPPGDVAAPPAAESAEASRAAAWRQTVEAARREGKLSIYGPPGDAVQEALVQGFRERYPEITVEYTAGNNTQLAPKILNEASAGLHIADLHIGGTDAPVLVLLKSCVLYSIDY
jgi:hypothetical protein